MKKENNFLISFNPTKEDKAEINEILAKLSNYLIKLNAKDDNIFAAAAIFSLSANAVLYGNKITLDSLKALQAFILTKIGEDEKE